MKTLTELNEKWIALNATLSSIDIDSDEAVNIAGEMADINAKMDTIEDEFNDEKL